MWYPVITAGAENASSALLKISIHAFHSPPPKEFVVQSASACSVMFKVHQASCLVAVESFFKKSLQKEIRWRKVW